MLAGPRTVYSVTRYDARIGSVGIGETQLLMQNRGQRLEEQRLLFGEHGSKVEDEAVVFDTGDDGDAGRGAAKPLLEFCRGVPGAGDSNHLRRQRL